ncbi:MAG: hypothetical protein ACM32E_13315 [Gemmatimonadota bacterium]
MRGFRWLALALAAVVAAGCAGGGTPASPRGPSFAAMSRQAVATLEHRYYHPPGQWNVCVPVRCGAQNLDWGSDSLTYALWLHWLISRDPRVRPMMDALTATALSYTPQTSSSSDVPAWDSIADLREYQVTGNPSALAKAEAAFGWLGDKAPSFALGACPGIVYQLPGGDGTLLKTMESDSNYVKAALLLYQSTHYRPYLRQALTRYAAIRRTYFEPPTQLYSVYVFDTGKACHRAPGRYFGSVNGNMIWSGYTLARLTGQRGYLSQAIATARAVRQHLGDATGVYADLQAENDIAEPLVEAMYLLATAGHQGFARSWLLTAAGAAAGAVNASGAYGRFFGGPPPRAPVTVWQVNGGLSLALAAGALAPRLRAADPGFWRRAVYVRRDLRLSGQQPVRFAFTGRAVAIIGTIGEQCCFSGHARLYLDGRQSFDQTGIWQNKSSSGKSLPGSVLFAWRWPRSGRHVIEIRPGIPNAKEGVSFFHMAGYYVVR